jgi:hypothetical protein
MQIFNNISDSLKNNFKDWSFQNVFDRKGVQAVCGTLTNSNNFINSYPFNTTTNTIVYKVGAHPERINEHEADVMYETNSLKEYSPHFTYLFHSANLVINDNFIYTNFKDSKNSSTGTTLFSVSNNSVENKERFVLFMEYISNIHLKHVLRLNDDTLSSCLIVMCLAAIQQGIDHCKFNHYDLHIDNILIKECEQNSFFAYRFKDNTTILTPTKGFYPVFIDYGTSYTQNYNSIGNKCKTSVINAYHGLQPTVFDELIDVHQMLFNSVYESEKESVRYDHISTHLMHIFKYVKMTREMGWKILPFDIFDCILNKICEYKPNIEDDYQIMNEKQSEIIDLLTLSIELPFKLIDSETLKNIEQFYPDKSKNKNKTKKIINNDENILSEHNQKKCEYLLSESFEMWCKLITDVQKSLIKNKYIKYMHPKDENDNPNRDLYYIIRDIITNTDIPSYIANYKDNEKWNIQKIKTVTSHISNLLSHFYYQYFNTHETVIKEMYSKMKFKKIADFSNFIQQHAPVRPVSNDSIIYVFDSITKTQKKITRDMSDYEPGKKWRTKVLNEIFKNDS